MSNIASDYGSAAILVGKAKQKLESEDFTVFTDNQEYRTKEAFFGEYSVIDLYADEVIIIGPKHELEGIKGTDKMNIFFIEDLSESIKSKYFPFKNCFK